jgi:hypothetical protein
MELTWPVATAPRDERKLLLGIAERPNANPLSRLSPAETVGGDQQQPHQEDREDPEGVARVHSSARKLSPT